MEPLLASSLPQKDLKLLQCKIIHKDWLTPKIVRLRFDEPYIAKLSNPGQFINIKVSDNYVPLLRRPFSIHRVDRENGWFEILFKVIGMGTHALAQHEVGARLDILGPLGNSFQIQAQNDSAVLIAGGLGIAPLLFLAQELVRNNIASTLFYGNKSKDEICAIQDFNELGVAHFLATEDGSAGLKGRVTELISAKNSVLAQPNSMIYACGPNPMLQRIKELMAMMGKTCQVSLETLMACGFGVCLGCVVNSTSASNPYKYVCKDGPVFYTSEIDLRD
ncbi:dihydroorotate dehydrogenase electron transfer subunit [candidate division KSB1 bacterium]|nr:dihydroorotate dehydrogenase electron transfer subunit [candidate division KSB1 bacterium]